MSILTCRISKLPIWLLLLVVIVSAAVAVALIGRPNIPAQSSNKPCRGVATCLTGSVTHIVDGDTLDVGGRRIRLALVNSPEVGESGYAEAKQFTTQACPLGTQAQVDEDDGQTAGSYGRMIALVYCQGVNLNRALLDSGNAALVSSFCSVSEFADEPWTGCA